MVAASLVLRNTSFNASAVTCILLDFTSTTLHLFNYCAIILLHLETIINVALSFITVRNEVGARLCFYTCL